MVVDSNGKEIGPNDCKSSSNTYQQGLFRPRWRQKETLQLDLNDDLERKPLARHLHIKHIEFNNSMIQHGQISVAKRQLIKCMRTFPPWSKDSTWQSLLKVYHNEINILQAQSKAAIVAYHVTSLSCCQYNINCAIVIYPVPQRLLKLYKDAFRNR